VSIQVQKVSSVWASLGWTLGPEIIVAVSGWIMGYKNECIYGRTTMSVFGRTMCGLLRQVENLELDLPRDGSWRMTASRWGWLGI
jgi:hypothetical protein